jgi:hypothetical protein
MSGWKYMFYSILFLIPVIGLIFLIVCSVKDTNINRRSFARSYFCALLFALMIVAALVGTVIALVAAGVLTQDMITQVYNKVLALIPKAA